jgi:DNA-binding response OmpR family regulator
MSSAEASSCSTASRARKQTRVLVVEDEKLVNWALVTSLTKWGFAVHPVFTGWDAVKEFQKCGFDVVLLDYQLPDLDGLAVARQIRHLQPDAVIVLLTSFPLSELPPDRSLINYYCNKPVDLGQLRTDLKRISNKEELGNEGDRLLS